MRTVMTFLACVAIASLATGCSRSSEWCEAKCACEGCSERDYDECIIVRDAEEDKADVYGCGDTFALYHDCTMENNDCDLLNLVDIFRHESVCNDEWAEWQECLNEGSARR